MTDQQGPERAREQQAVMHALCESWRAQPELRLIQLLFNAVREPGMVMDPRLYNVKDATVLAALRGTW